MPVDAVHTLDKFLSLSFVQNGTKVSCVSTLLRSARPWVSHEPEDVLDGWGRRFDGPPRNDAERCRQSTVEHVVMLRWVISIFECRSTVSMFLFLLSALWFRCRRKKEIKINKTRTKTKKKKTTHTCREEHTSRRAETR